MSWFQKSKKIEKMGAVVAIEGLSADIVDTQLHALEQELHTTGFVVQRLAFPSSAAEENIPGLLKTPEIFQGVRAVGLVAALDRAKTLATTEALVINGEVVLLTGGALASAAWLASTLSEYGDRVALYRWLDELEHIVFNERRIELTVFIDTLPEHIDMRETVIAPVGWDDAIVPEVATLRDRYLEAAKLLPAVKVVSSHRDGLLKPDTEITNEIWNLVRRVALKMNLRPRVQ